MAVLSSRVQQSMAVLSCRAQRSMTALTSEAQRSMLVPSALSADQIKVTLVAIVPTYLLFQNKSWQSTHHMHIKSLCATF